MRRVVSLWLPRFPTDRLCRRQVAEHGRPSLWRDEPLVTVAPVGADTLGRGTSHTGLRLVAINAAAARAGLRPGLPLADARALEPTLRVMPADPHGDRRALAALAGWCGQYSPWTAPSGLEADGSAGLWIDISGCDHLFGGEAQLLASLTDRLRQHGYATRAAIADTPGAAWATARFAAPPTLALPHKGGGNQARCEYPLPPGGGGLGRGAPLNKLGGGEQKKRGKELNKKTTSSPRTLKSMLSPPCRSPRSA